MSDFTNEISILDQFARQLTKAQEIFELAKVYDPLVEQVEKLKVDRIDEEQRLEETKQRTHAEKGEINQQLEEFKQRANEETSKLYKYLEGVKLTVQTQVSDVEREGAVRIQEINSQIDKANETLAAINKRIKDAEAALALLKGA